MNSKGQMSKSAEEDGCAYMVINTESGCTYIINEFGCTWCDGVGDAPDGLTCGECDSICSRHCSVRNRQEEE